MLTTWGVLPRGSERAQGGNIRWAGGCLGDGTQAQDKKHLSCWSPKGKNPPSTKNMGNWNFKAGFYKIADFCLLGEREKSPYEC